MKVLAALDFGDASLEALRQARALAHGIGGALAGCHVLPADHDLSFLFPARAAAVDSDAEVEDQQVRDALRERVRTKLGLELSELFVERGAAYAQLVRRAEAYAADFIVVGSHDKTGLSRLVLGSVAERVVRHAHCSVLVARASQKGGVVVAATDLSEPSLEAVSAAADAANRTGARLLVVSALDWPTHATDPAMALIGAVPVAPPEELQRETRDVLRSMLEQAMTRLGVVGEVRVLHGAAAPAVVACADEVGAELVVVATHGRTGLQRLALGSVTEHVIRNAGCSVLVTRTASDGREPQAPLDAR
jgi:nucleotide-binding universal stress UspA family protein